ncbi:MAG: radical SAM protein [Thermoplasmata archaeon]
MNIYQIVKFKDNSAYATFWGCDWNCTYCIWKSQKWNICLPQDVRDELDRRWRENRIRFLEIDEFIKILKSNGVNLVFLGGGEPTLDPHLKDLLLALKSEKIESWIITNSEHLDDDIFELSKGLTMSLKAFDPDLHLKLTGHSNEEVIKNFKKFGQSSKIVAESVYSKGLVECDEMIKIATFLAGINKDMRFRIDPEVGGYQEIDDCIENVKEILPNTYRIKASGNIPPELLYPEKE